MRSERGHESAAPALLLGLRQVVAARLRFLRCYAREAARYERRLRPARRAADGSRLSRDPPMTPSTTGHPDILQSSPDKLEKSCALVHDWSGGHRQRRTILVLGFDLGAHVQGVRLNCFLSCAHR